MKLSQQIGANLKTARKQKGYTQEALAKKLGILQPAYARYESGKIELNYDQIQELCTILEITPNFLWGFEDEYGNLNF
ncbi:MAG: helix-turn-helix transcriptional regulator [Clostridia bacterium]|nr:helix-turn-helix transcriptional regulator [Clostridia bacterium]